MTDTQIKTFISEHAESVIETFGGIRPMATKLGVAATTIQGWKKRGTIPSARVQFVIEKAEEHGLLDKLQGQAAQKDQGAKEERPAARTANTGAAANDDAIREFKDFRKSIMSAHGGSAGTLSQSEISSSSPKTPKDGSSQTNSKGSVTQFQEKREVSKQDQFNTDKDVIARPAGPEETVYERMDLLNDHLKKTESRAVRKSTWVSTVLFAMFFVLITVIFWPVKKQSDEQETRLANMEETVTGIAEEQEQQRSFFGQMIPEDLQQRFDNVSEQAGNVGANLGAQAGAALDQTTSSVQEISRNVMSGNTDAALSSVQEVVGDLQRMVGSFDGSSVMQQLTQLSATPQGQEQLARSENQLQGIVKSLEGQPELIDDALRIARTNSTALGQTFEDVPDDDLKAAALLFTLTQFRSALNREGQPFNEDMEVLRGLLGEDISPELETSLQRLTPHAEAGVLSFNGLSNEFRSTAGNIAVAAMRGEDVSISDEASASFDRIMALEENGRPVLPANTAQTLTQTQALLEQGNGTEALSLLQQLQGPEAAAAAPFIRQLEASINAGRLDQAIGTALQDTFGLGGPRPINLQDPQQDPLGQVMPQSNVISDRESGFGILPNNGPQIPDGTELPQMPNTLQQP